MSGIEWADHINPQAPKQSDQTRRIDAIVRELQANPGRAARVKTDVSYHAHPNNPYRKRGCLVVTRRSTVGNGIDHFASWPAPPAISEPAAATTVSDLASFRAIGQHRIGAAA